MGVEIWMRNGAGTNVGRCALPEIGVSGRPGADRSFESRSPMARALRSDGRSRQTHDLAQGTAKSLA